MAERLKPVDVVTVGVGMTASILAKELAATGLKVVGIERGPPRDTVPDFQSPAMHDELRFAVRKGLMVDAARETFTFRSQRDQTALPLRRLSGFLPGTGLGGSMVHWNGTTLRFQVADFVYRSHIEARYGKSFLDPDLTIQDWGVTYDELEPSYDRFEYLCGVSGKAGNLKGQIQPGGNPFEGWRAREYPTPPMKEPYAAALFRKAALGLGYHPFPMPSANLSEPYTNPEGVSLHACVYCGFCERFACEHYAKSSPQTIVLPALRQIANFEPRYNCQVLKINLDNTGRKATGVTYADAAGKEFEQPAELVLLTAFALNNVRLLLLSGIGVPYEPQTNDGVVGRNYSYQTVSGVDVFYDESVNINPFMGSGAIGNIIDDFSGDNFDHGPHRFIGGAYIGSNMTGGRPIEFHPVPPGTPAWGAGWKEAVRRSYNHTATLFTHGTSTSNRALRHAVQCRIAAFAGARDCSGHRREFVSLHHEDDARAPILCGQSARRSRRDPGRRQFGDGLRLSTRIRAAVEGHGQAGQGFRRDDA
jgi:gluconate 2-dehydrogenase alpha chain